MKKEACRSFFVFWQKDLMYEEINDMLMKPVEYQRHFFNRMNSDTRYNKGSKWECMGKWENDRWRK